MKRMIRTTFGVVALLLAAAAWADKRSVIIQCASSCDAAVASVQRLGGEVTTRYKNVAALAASLPEAKMAELSAAAGIKAVRKDVLVNLPQPGTGKRATTFEVEDAVDVQVLDSAQVASVAAAQPADYAFNNALIGASSLHAGGNTGAGVIVAVIDTGTANSPVVPSLLGTVIGGENFVPGASEPSATSRNNGPHGTWVGGVIASHVAFGFNNTSTLVRSLKANGAGTFTGSCPNPPPTVACFVPVIGVAPSAKIYALKVFAAAGGGSPESRVIAAMDRAITLRRNFNSGMSTAPVSGSGSENDPYVYNALNIAVVNMSLGGPTLAAGHDVEDELTLQMVDAGITLAASAGNDGPVSMTGGSPGSGFGSLTLGAASTFRHERILRDNQFGLGIGALYRPTEHTQTAFFSSRGPTADGRLDPDVTANGFATFAQGTCRAFSSATSRAACLAGTILAPLSFVSGTSFSSPTAAGAAALLRKASATATAAQIRNSLIVTANPGALGDGSGPIDQGAGFINVAAAASALAAGSVPSSFERSNKPNGQVRQNVQHLGFDEVKFTDDRFTTRVSNLKPGQVAQFFVRSRSDTTRIVVKVSNITPALPPAQQNALFGDDILLHVVDAPTSFAETVFQDFIFSDTTVGVNNPQAGMVRVAVQGDWTNAGMISADVTIEQQRDPLPGHTAKGDVSTGSLSAVPVDMPAGTAQAVFELFWDGDWATFPTSDVDMVIVDPSGAANAAGSTLASPERVVVDNPAAGRWAVLVNGFQVNGKKEKYELRVTADGARLKAAK